MRSRNIVIVVAFLALAACDQLKEGPHRMETYSLCPRGNESRSRLRELVLNFAVLNQAKFTDRGAESQGELSAMQGSKGALNSTGGTLIVLAVEKPNDFRVSLSNLGLRDKVSMGVRYWNSGPGNVRIAKLLTEIEHSWVIQRVEGGVSDDPPCDP
jgi:hypothetical protein